MRWAILIAARQQHGPQPNPRSWILAFAGMTILMMGLDYPAETFAAGPYKIDWYTIDGGGTSSGGPYVLTGTIGQPDADWSRGEKYELLSGFWPGGPVCIVEFDDFARFAEQWFLSGSGLPADLDNDNDVDFGDLSRLSDYWLSGCPYNWALKW